MSARRVFTEQHALEELSALRCDDALIGFGRALSEAHGDLDWAYFLTKPWKWASEYVAWVNADYPTTDDIEAWDQFCAAVGS